MRLIYALHAKSSKDDLKGRRWQQLAVVQYKFIPLEVAVITFWTAEYRRKDSLKLIFKSQVKVVIKM
jgi:hypothetical protein